MSATIELLNKPLQYIGHGGWEVGYFIYIGPCKGYKTIRNNGVFEKTISDNGP